MCVCVCIHIHTRVEYIYVKIDRNINKNTHKGQAIHQVQSRTKKKEIWLPSDILLLLWHLPQRSRDVTVELSWSAAASALAPSAPMPLTGERVRKERRRQYSQTSSSQRLLLQRPLYTDHTHTHTHIHSKAYQASRGVCVRGGGVCIFVAVRENKMLHIRCVYMCTFENYSIHARGNYKALLRLYSCKLYAIMKHACRRCIYTYMYQNIHTCSISGLGCRV